MLDARLPEWIAVAGTTQSPQRSNYIRRNTPNSSPNNYNNNGSPSSPVPKPCALARTMVPLRTAQKIGQPFCKESFLVSLCRQGRWEEALDRCQHYPEEAVPCLNTSFGVNHNSNGKKRRHCDGGNPSNSPTLFYDTALGILCASDFHHPNNHRDQRSVVEAAEALARTLVTICPNQVRCSQLVPGHTPLRDAVRNPSCPPTILNILLTADLNVGDKDVITEHQQQLAISQRDRDGLLALDHIIKAVQLGRSDHIFPVLECFVEAIVKYPEDAVHMDCHSPLVRLFSLGTSFGVLPPCSSLSLPPSNTTNQEQMDPRRLNRILRCTKCLLKANPTLIYRHARSTGCSPLHVAIRNYGNFIELIRELVMADEKGIIMKHRNHYGDLPLHVACLVGVPIKILQLILDRTLVASSQSLHSSCASGSTIRYHQHNKPNPLIWSTNHLGYTPVDLEWIRNIEGKNSSFSHPTFNPLDTGGIRKPGGRCNELYDSLLRQAVDQILNSHKGSKTSEDTTKQDHTKETATPTNSANDDKSFGPLLQRIFLIVQATFHEEFPSNNLEFSCDNILHRVSSLSGPTGPTLPRPLLELILWNHTEQIHLKDCLGKLPLHRAVQVRQPQAHRVQEAKAAKEWKLWVEKLFQLAPDACTVTDDLGRLPLHCALDPADDLRSPLQASQGLFTNTYLKQARDEVIMDLLIARYPEGVEVRDPISGLYPFMLAAVSSSVPVETVFSLLRMSPGILK